MNTVVMVAAEHVEELRRVAVEIDPDGLYDAPEAALVLNIEGCRKYRQERMYQIPESVLPRERRGPNGKRWAWRGRALLEHRKRLGL